ncbi:MAG: sigma-70 family RNA polymerase sigma factor [Planctomycetota bacterium]
MSDERVTEETLLAHAEFVRRLARALTGEHLLADDVSQEVFVRALQQPPPSSVRIRGWLSVVTRNVVRQLRRGEGRRKRRELTVTERAVSLPPDHVLQQAILARKIAELVEGLEEPYRSTVWERFYEGHSPQQIAARTGVNAATVRSRLRRALAKIRGELDRDSGGRDGWLNVLVMTSPANFAIGGALVKTKLAIAAAFIAVILMALYWSGTTVLESSSPRTSKSPSVLHPLEPESLSSGEHAMTSLPKVPSSGTDQKLTSASCLVIGRCIDREGEPVESALVKWGRGRALLTDRDAIPSVMTDAEGQFEWTLPWRDDRSGGEVTLAIHARHHREKLETFWAVRGQTVWLPDTVLEPGGAITGRVVDEAGVPIGQASVGAIDIDTIDERQRLDEDEERIFGPGGFQSVSLFGARSVTTQADGTFRIDSLSPGDYEVWAGEGQRTFGRRAGTIRVEADQTVDAEELVLAAVPGEHWIRGVVLDPAGNSVAGVKVSFEQLFQSDPTRSMFRWIEPDKDGRLTIRCSARGVGRLRIANGRGQAWSPIVPRDVPAGSDLELRVEALRSVPVEAVDPEGRPVPITLIESEAHLGEGVEWMPLTSWWNHFSEGPIAIGVPGDAVVRLRVEARGYESFYTELGPGSSIPDTLRLELTTQPAVRGVVVADEVPVEGAWVYCLRDPLEEGPAKAILVSEYPVKARVGLSHWRADSTDGSGAFDLPLPELEDHLLFVEADGFARSEPFELSATNGGFAQDLRIAMSRGGVLTGQVTTRDGSDPKGLVVVAVDAWGLCQSTRVDLTGTYQFECLPAGELRIGLHDRDVFWHQPGKREPTEPPVMNPEGKVMIREGATATLDLAWKPAPTFTLEGTIGISGMVLRDWTARLIGSKQHETTTTEPSPVSPTGRFHLSAPQPGNYRLRIEGRDGEAHWKIEQKVRLERARNYWSFAVDTGVVRGRTRITEETPREVRVIVKDDVEIDVRSRLDENDTFSLRCPAGERSLTAIGYTRTVEVIAGGTVDLELVHPSLR